MRLSKGIAHHPEEDRGAEESRGIKYWLALNSKTKDGMASHLPKKQNSNSST